MSTDHGDTGLDVSEFMDEAEDDIIEALLRYGQWPKPAKRSSEPSPAIEFDLYDFLLERIDPSELLEFYILSLDETRFYSRFDGEQEKARKRVRAMLQKHLAGSQLVRDQAERLAEENQ